MVRVISTFLFSALIAGCDGSGGSGGGQEIESNRTIPEAPAVEVVNFSSGTVTFQWTHPNPSSIQNYQVYSAAEAITDKDNYSVFAESELDLDAQSPYAFNGQKLEPVYHVYVSAVGEDAESVLSNSVIALPRYEITEDNQWVRDRVNDLEWQRCFYGMKFDSGQNECIGEAERFTFSDAKTAVSEIGARLPSADEMVTLLLCESAGTAYLPSNHDPVSTEATNCLEATPAGVDGSSLSFIGVYPLVFKGIPSDSHAWTDSRCDDGFADSAEDLFIIWDGDTTAHCAHQGERFLQYLRAVRDIGI